SVTVSAASLNTSLAKLRSKVKTLTTLSPSNLEVLQRQVTYVYGQYMRTEALVGDLELEVVRLVEEH
ncbi:UNVERIFIED_CONTAM: hypothetical protein RF648_21470, partial [Kocuria sp. CPCC 205274]